MPPRPRPRPRPRPLSFAAGPVLPCRRRRPARRCAREGAPAPSVGLLLVPVPPPRPQLASLSPPPALLYHCNRYHDHRHHDGHHHDGHHQHQHRQRGSAHDHHDHQQQHNQKQQRLQARGEKTAWRHRMRTASGLAAAVVIDADFLPAWSPAHVDVHQASQPPPPSPQAIPPPQALPPQTSCGCSEPRGGDHTLASPSIALEVRVLVRLLVAVIVGGIIGVERRTANSLAGVRTFSLVSLGASMFMSTALVGFPQSDPVRFGAAISTSVGFLGAGAMHQGRTYRRGMTTAAGIWLAAALGIAAAAGMFLVAFTGSIATVLISRYLRFDSSLHLIRYDEDPGREPPEDVPARVTDRSAPDPEDIKPQQYHVNAAPWNGNGIHSGEDRSSSPGAAAKEGESNGVHAQATEDSRD